MMKARFGIVGAMIVFACVCESARAQGNVSANPFERKRTVNIMTPGNLYRNPAPNPTFPRTFNKPSQPGSRAASPQTPSTAQPTAKTPTVNMPVQTSPFVTPPSSPFNTAPKTAPPQASPFASVFTPSQPASQSQAQQPPPLYNLNPVQSPVAQPASPYAAGLPVPPLPSVQPTPYPMPPQFTTGTQLPVGGLPNATAATPVKQPFYSMGQPMNPLQPPRPGAPQSGVGATALPQAAAVDRASVPGPGSTTIPLSSSALSTPLATPLVTPLTTPLNTQLQQPFYMPQTPFAGPQPTQPVQSPKRP